MAKIENVVAAMRKNPKNIRFQDLCKVCDHYFGEHRQKVAAIAFTRRRGLVIHA